MYKKRLHTNIFFIICQGSQFCLAFNDKTTFESWRLSQGFSLLAFLMVANRGSKGLSASNKSSDNWFANSFRQKDELEHVFKSFSAISCLRLP